MNLTESFRDILENLNESADTGYQENLNEDEEQLYIVTEGWSDDDIQIMNEEFGEDGTLEILEEGIFSGMPKHIIKNMVNHEVMAGENSSVAVHKPTNKNQFHKTVKAALDDKNNHVVVKHKGQVIASVHPQVNARNYNTDRGDSLPKTRALKHLHDKIEDNGGHKAGLEVHVIGRDTKRAAIRQDKFNKAVNYLDMDNLSDKPRSFASIAGRAAARTTSAHKILHDKAMTHHKKAENAMKSGNYEDAAENYRHAMNLANEAKYKKNSGGGRVQAAKRYGYVKDTQTKKDRLDSEIKSYRSMYKMMN